MTDLISPPGEPWQRSLRQTRDGSYLDWDAFGHALADHVRYRNSPAERERRKIEAAKRRKRGAAKTTSELKLAA